MKNIKRNKLVVMHEAPVANIVTSTHHVRSASYIYQQGYHICLKYLCGTLYIIAKAIHEN